MPTKTKIKPKKKPEATSELDVSATKSANDLPHTATEAPVAVIAPPEAALSYVQHTEAGLVIRDGMPFETWLAGAPTYEMMFRKAPWWWGDYLIYGERNYGEEHAQAVSGYTEGHVDNVVSVCSRFPIERRQPSLFFSHHKAAASLPPQEADRLLIQGAREHWTLKDISGKVALYHEVNGTKPRRGRKKKSALSLQSEKTSPPTLDGHLTLEPAPLIWNGHPLSVMVMPDATRVILQGNEPLPTEEADRAAHHFKHAHGPALASWLDEHNFRRTPEPITTISGEPHTPTPPTLISIPFIPAPNLPQPEAPAPAQPASKPVAAQVEPKATPEPPAGAPPITETLQAADNALKMIDGYEGKGLCQEIRAAISRSDGITKEPPRDGKWIDQWGSCKVCGGEIPHGHTNTCDIYKLECERDDAREQLKRYDIHTAAETPLEAAERHILAFNAASEQVDWSTLGNLAKKKWLERLMLRADVVIDILQKQPVTPRK